jgi:hypothetical protein
LGDLANESVEINKKLCSLEFLVLLVQAKRTKKKKWLKYLKLGVPKVFEGCGACSVFCTAFYLLKDKRINGSEESSDHDLKKTSSNFTNFTNVFRKRKTTFAIEYSQLPLNKCEAFNQGIHSFLVDFKVS